MRLHDTTHAASISELLDTWRMPSMKGATMSEPAFSRTCTTLDHVYPNPKFGRPCYCGARTWGGKNSSPTSQKGVDTPRGSEVESVQQSINQPAPGGGTRSEPAISAGAKTMTFTLRGLSKNGKQAYYDGANQVLRVAIGSFAAGTAPTSFDVADGVFAGPKQPKAKMTAEERKAARAAQPKPTLAEKIAKREAALAKLREKAAAEGQPAL